MLKKIKILTAAVLCIVLLNSVYANAEETPQAKIDSLFSGMTQKEKEEAAGEYFFEIMKFIDENYIGDNEVSTQKLLQAAIKGMANELDPYSDYLTCEEYDDVKKAESGVYYTAGIECIFSEDDYPRVTSVSESSGAAGMGLTVNNYITSINGTSTYGIQKTEFTTLITSNEPKNISLTYTKLSKKYTIEFPLTYIKVNSVQRIDMSQMSTKNSRTGYTDNSVAGIKISAFASGTADEFKTMMQQIQNEGATRLILDLRGNTGGYVDQAIEVGKLIVPAGLIISSKDKKGNYKNYMSTLYTKPFEKIVVLVDGMTASAAEIIASALQESGAATVIGEKTYGKGVMQSVTDFSELGVLKMTTYEYYTRTGKKVNGVGITPDVPVGKVLFVSEEDALDSDKVKAALELLGLTADNTSDARKSIGKFQSMNSLPITYKLDQKTVSAINVKIYADMLTNDRTLKTAYLHIIS